MSLYAGLNRGYAGDDFVKALLASSENHREEIRQGIGETLKRYPTWDIIVETLPLVCALRDPDEVEKLFVVWRSLHNGNISPPPTDIRRFCRWPVEKTVDPSIFAPPVPGADPGVQKAKTP
jgi:hypothetical protein